jgi:hypothetical protein
MKNALIGDKWNILNIDIANFVSSLLSKVDSLVEILLGIYFFKKRVDINNYSF